MKNLINVLVLISFLLISQNIFGQDIGKVSFSATGAFKEAIANGTADNTNLGIGSIGLYAISKEKMFEVNIGTSSALNVSTFNKQNFVGNIIVPQGGLAFFHFDYKNWNDEKAIKLNFLADLSYSKLKFQDTSENSVINFIPLAISSHISFIPFDNYRNNFNNNVNKYLVSFDIGFTSRLLLGDVGGHLDQIQKYTGIGQVGYFGAEIGCNIWINNVRGLIYLPILFGPHVDGLTGGQLVFGIGLHGDIFDILNTSGISNTLRILRLQ